MERQQITLRLPADVKKWLQEEADRLGISLNAVAVMIFQQKMNEK